MQAVHDSEPGICPACRFSLETGSITDISIRLVDLTWGDPEEAIPSSPSQVVEDNMNNYSDTETTKTTFSLGCFNFEVCTSHYVSSYMYLII